jgi:hypothetical protein
MASSFKDRMTQIMPCSICYHPMSIERSHNAQPINDGRCCDTCNTIRVIPARIAALFDLEQKREDKDGVA